MLIHCQLLLGDATSSKQRRQGNKASDRSVAYIQKTLVIFADYQRF